VPYWLGYRHTYISSDAWVVWGGGATITHKRGKKYVKLLLMQDVEYKYKRIIKLYQSVVCQSQWYLEPDSV
jgi:hypothetical protein